MQEWALMLCSCDYQWTVHNFTSCVFLNCLYAVVHSNSDLNYSYIKVLRLSVFKFVKSSVSQNIKYCLWNRFRVFHAVPSSLWMDEWMLCLHGFYSSIVSVSHRLIDKMSPIIIIFFVFNTLPALSSLDVYLYMTEPSRSWLVHGNAFHSILGRNLSISSGYIPATGQN